MSNPWFRTYVDLIDNPKFIKLGPDLARALLMMWCVAGQNDGKLPPIEDIAIKFRMSEARSQKLIDELKRGGWIDQTETGLTPHNWAKRQYKSDVSSNRVKQFRERRRNVSETPPDTEADTEADNRSRPEATASGARKRATRLSPEWWPSVEDVNYAIAKGLSEQRVSTESEKFRNYWTAKSGAGATKLDWHATWQNWIITAAQQTGGPQNGQRKQSSSDRALELAELARSAERARGIG
jgi:hypothetical protein